MSNYQFGDEEFISVDVVTGNVILRLPSQLLSFEDPAHYAAWVLEHADHLPALRAAWEAAMAPKRSDRPQDSPSNDCDWVVMINAPSHGSYDDLVGKIVHATGWPAETAEIEVDCGFPLTLGAGLTFAEALELKNRTVECGLSAEIGNISPT
jgi:hypothetical protein